jgi:hypothetical protein
MRRRLLWLYPEAWRKRYGEELSALLDDTPPSVGATVDLLMGAVLAHLRPLPHLAPARQARGTIAGVLGCFIVFCFAGAGFAKTTENFDPAERTHPLLGISHELVLIGAVVAGAALAAAALPLIFASVGQAWRTREPTLVKLIAVPPLAIAVLLASIGLLALGLSADHHRGDLLAWLLLCLCGVCAVAGGFACWAAPRAIMRRLQVTPDTWRLSVPAVSLAALAMLIVAVATATFLIGLMLDAPRLGAMGNGPGQLVNVTTSIAIQVAAMLVLGSAAVLSATRGLRAVMTA